MGTYQKLLTYAIGLFLLTGLSGSTRGELHPDSGATGPLTTSGSSEGAGDVAVQTDGKIVAVGSVTVSNARDFAVFRYNPDGSLDTSFDGDGKVTTNFGNGSDSAHATAIQADGKIIAAGGTSDGVSNWRFALVRYNTDGSPDNSFGLGGKVITEGGGLIEDIAIQPDGKIVAVGSDNLRFRIARYNPDGSLDASFGSGGIISPTWGKAYSAAVQADGKIVAAGESVACDEKNCNYSFVLARFNTDGSLDNSFGTYPGIVWANFGSNNQSARAVAVQPDGRILAAGFSGNCSGYLCDADFFALARFNADGSLDTTFDVDGKVLTTLGDSSWANSLILQSDGKIVAVGVSVISSADYDFALARYNQNGSLDTSFDSDGRLTTGFGNSQRYDLASGVAVQTNGKIVAAGSSREGADSDFALSRYNVDGSLDTSFDGDGKVRTSFIDASATFDFDGDGRSDISVFRPSNRVWYLDQSTNGFSATEFGLSTDKVTPADYDGDGKTDIAVYRDGAWWIRKSGDGTVETRTFGVTGDIPVPRDYTGDGRDEIAVYRNGQWWALDLSNGQTSLVNFGLPTDKPVPADYDGDGRTDLAVYRNGEWHINRSSQGYVVIQFGLAADRPVAADYDGDGKTDIAIYRNGEWHRFGSTTGYTVVNFGLESDVPVPADYDGDGKTEVAVFRSGTWYINRSTGGVSIQQFGSPNDSPVPAAYSGF